MYKKEAVASFLHSRMVDKLGGGGEFKLKFTPVGVGASTTRVTERARLFHSQKPSERFNPRLPCVKGAVAAKPIVFKGFVRD